MSDQKTLDSNMSIVVKYMDSAFENSLGRPLVLMSPAPLMPGAHMRDVFSNIWLKKGSCSPCDETRPCATWNRHCPSLSNDPVLCGVFRSKMISFSVQLLVRFNIFTLSKHLRNGPKKFSCSIQSCVLSFAITHTWH